MIDPSASIKFGVVKHTAFGKVARFLQAIDGSPPGTMSFVVGASGVGKSTLASMLGPMLYGTCSSPCVKPFICVKASNPQAGYFTSKYLLEQILAKFADPFRGSHVLLDELPDDIHRVVSNELRDTSRPQSEPDTRIAA